MYPYILFVEDCRILDTFIHIWNVSLFGDLNNKFKNRKEIKTDATHHCNVSYAQNGKSNFHAVRLRLLLQWSSCALQSPILEFVLVKTSKTIKRKNINLTLDIHKSIMSFYLLR